MFHVVDGAAEKAGSQRLEFGDGIGGEKGAGGRPRWIRTCGETGGDGACGGICGVDDADGPMGRKAQQFSLKSIPEKRVMRAAEKQAGGLQTLGCGLIESFLQIDAEHFGGDGVADPALFDERYEKGAGLLRGGQAESGAGAGVGVALHGGRGGENQDAACGLG